MDFNCTIKNNCQLMVWTMNYCLSRLLLCTMNVWSNLINSSLVSAFRKIPLKHYISKHIRAGEPTTKIFMEKAHVDAQVDLNLGIPLLQECCPGNCACLAMYIYFSNDQWVIEIHYICTDRSICGMPTTINLCDMNCIVYLSIACIQYMFWMN